MKKMHLFRIEISGERVPVSRDEIHQVRRFILDFYEDNLSEPMNLFVTRDAFEFEFWKFLSISYDRKFAQSRREVWVIERGCLAMINGFALDLLGEELGPAKSLWGKAKDIADASLAYLEAYEPSEPQLNEARDFLLTTFRFIRDMTADDFDEDGYVKHSLVEQGQWFSQNIVADYFLSTVHHEFEIAPKRRGWLRKCSIRLKRHLA